MNKSNFKSKENKFSHNSLLNRIRRKIHLHLSYNQNFPHLTKNYFKS